MPALARWNATFPAACIGTEKLKRGGRPASFFSVRTLAMGLPTFGEIISSGEGSNLGCKLSRPLAPECSDSCGSCCLMLPILKGREIAVLLEVTKRGAFQPSGVGSLFKDVSVLAEEFHKLMPLLGDVAYGDERRR